MFIAVVVIIVYFITTGAAPLFPVSWQTQRGARRLKELHYMFGGCINTNISILFFLPGIFP